MNQTELQLRSVGDPRLAVHASSSLPAWLWATDGSRILWANPVGVKLFGATNSAALAAKRFGPADPHRRQVAQLAGRLAKAEAIRLERLRGFGAPLGRLVTCACAQIEFPDGVAGILIAAAEPIGRAMPLVERLQQLIEGIDTPIAAFARDGLFVGASDAARALLGFRNLTDAGLDAARDNALKDGRAETPIGIGHMVLQRVGSGTDVGLVALIAPGAVSAAAQPRVRAALLEHVTTVESEPERCVTDEHEGNPTDEACSEMVSGVTNHQTAEAASSITESGQPPDYEQFATTSEAPAEFLLIDEFAESAAESAIDDVTTEYTPEPAVFPEMIQDAAQQDGVREPEPSPYVEEVADEPSTSTTAKTPPTGGLSSSSTHASSTLDEPTHHPRRHPLRFMWQMNGEGLFSLASDEFSRLIGPNTAAAFGRPWSEIAKALGLDPAGLVLKAVATRETWSGITLGWPVDGSGERLPVELSGLPIYDRERKFTGYRGFGVCRDLEGLAHVATLRRVEFLSDTHSPQPLAADVPHPEASVAQEPDPPPPPLPTVTPVPPTEQFSLQPEPDMSIDPPKNVVPFRSVSDSKSPALTPVENNAFDELARQLSARLDPQNGATGEPAAPEAREEQIVAEPVSSHDGEPAGWLLPAEPPARVDIFRDRTLLDLLPVGVLIYRLDRLLYANRAFLNRTGYESLDALSDAGGLDALFVEPGTPSASSASDTGTPVTIAAAQASADRARRAGSEARLYAISWDGESAHALIFSNAHDHAVEPVAAEPTVAMAAPQPSAVGHANAEELGAILDTAAEGVVMFDASGRINSCNRSAEALFGYDGSDIVQRNLTDLFAPESQRVMLDYLDSLNGAGVASLLDHGREVLGRVREGGLIPISVTMGRTRHDSPNFFAVFRDLSQAKKSESELLHARRQADRGANAKADVLARISHEVRTPLNAIIGFAEVMIDARFGALGNERYVEYMKDIRASGERVIAIVSDLLDLSRIETGKLDLAFASQDLNEIVESCVAVMQPQANRDRIIIRTSLAHALPPIMADARVLRQIALNLIGNSIHLANAGGQVIVSTALSDFGDVVLRFRDTGHGLNDNEVAAAMEPFGNPTPSDQASSAGVNLSLTKALVEANRAQFQIKTAPQSGTLIEVVFGQAVARA